MKYVSLNYTTSDEVTYITVKKQDTIYVINKNAKYVVGTLECYGDKYHVEGEDHIFLCEKDAIECLLEKVLEYE